MDCKRWNFEASESGLRVCRDMHDKGQPCEYEELSPYETLDIINQLILKIIKLEIKNETTHKDAIHDDLLKAFVAYQYRLEHPMPTPEETEEFMCIYFHSNRMFKCRVNSLTSGVMQILNKYL